VFLAQARHTCIITAMERLTWPREDVAYAALTLALTIFAVAPLAYPGYMQVHSGFVPIYNLADLARQPLNPGWTPHVATGFDPLRGDGLLPYYLAVPIVWLGGTPLAGVKVIFGLGILLGAGGMYAWLRRPLGPAGATLAALVYTYLPYHIAAVYVRGAWGEALCLGLLPWALAATAAVVGRHRDWILLMSLTWTAVGLSQLGLAAWGVLLGVAWAAVSPWAADPPSRQKQRGTMSPQPSAPAATAFLDSTRQMPRGVGARQPRPYVAALLGILNAAILTFLAARLSFPASPVEFGDHFLYPAQLLSAYWGFGASRPGWNDGLALGFGMAAAGLTMLTLWLAFGAGRNSTAARPGSAARAGESAEGAELFVSARRARRLVEVLLLPALVLTLLLFSPTAFVWQVTGLHYLLTYPWQLLGLIGLCLAALAGTAPKLDARLAALPAQATLILLTLLASYSTLEPRFTQYAPGGGVLAAWDGDHVLLLDYALAVDIPPAAAGLGAATPERLPLADYGPPHPGDRLHLTLTWQATRPFERDLKLFVHLLDASDASGRIVAQVDLPAGAGAGPEGADYFTSQWDPGQLIADDVVITLPLDAPPGPYRLAFGLYDGDTLERLPVAGREDGRVVVGIGSKE
jgi:hypothetical protein